MKKVLRNVRFFYVAIGDLSPKDFVVLNVGNSYHSYTASHFGWCVIPVLN